MKKQEMIKLLQEQEEQYYQVMRANEKAMDYYAKECREKEYKKYREYFKKNRSMWCEYNIILYKMKIKTIREVRFEEAIKKARGLQ